VTKAQFEKLLNETYGVEAVGQGTKGNLKARVRPYGTYLRSQDREMFDAQYDIWVAAGGPTDLTQVQW
jgi:hypothetical protein